MSTEPVTLIYDRGSVSFDEACRSLEVGNVVARYGDWVVTDYGLECLATYYVIGADRLFEDWTLRHMREKRWIVYTDFCAAYEAARVHHRKTAVQPTPRSELTTTPGSPRRARRPGISNKVRFLVMKRDGYACQLCGRTAAQGYLLEIDHKIACANGGTSDIANLWVLCSTCNSGKSTLDL